MPADDDTVPYRMKDFIENGLSRHDRVESFVSLDHHRYLIKRIIGDQIEMYISGKYLFGEADYHDVKMNHPAVNCVVLGSLYASYTRGAKQAAADDGKGLLTYREFYGALNLKNYRAYVKREPKKK